MACRDDGQAAQHACEVEQVLRDKIDLLTRFLCEVMTGNESLRVSVELRRWWVEHQAADARRREAEEHQRAREEGERRDRIAEIEDELAGLRAKR